MSEHAIQNQILLECGSLSGVRLFRNNCGVGWTGDVQRLADGSIIIRNPRPLHAGLQKGSGDLIGWKSVAVSPEMVGTRVAILTSLECKTKTGRPSPDQLNWQRHVQEAGGLAGIVRSPKEARDVLKIVSGKRLTDSDLWGTAP